MQIPYERLMDLAEGRIPAAEASALRAYIAADPTAQAELARIEVLLELMQSDIGADAPEHVINRALRLVPRVEPQPSGLVRRLIATLQHDSWRPATATGLRSFQPWPRALLLSAGDRELDLQIAPVGERWQLRGQVLGSDETGEVTLHNAAAHVTVPLNELGEFVFSPIEAGRYTLAVVQGGLEIVVPDLELGPSPIES